MSEYLRLCSAAGLTLKTAAQAAGAVRGGAGTAATCGTPRWKQKTTPAMTTTTTETTGPLPPRRLRHRRPRRSSGWAAAIGDGGGWYFPHRRHGGVLSAHRRRGVGGAILQGLLGYIRAHTADGRPYVNLFADPPGRGLYARNGFVEVAAPGETGMVLRSQ